ncbi:MAG: hypothetical protein LBM62_10505 [Mediterranea sp.]|jgi:hypothetical protein|nr:hypothetical protein [Mediterranea sp.]
MNEKQLNEQESLELITRMIQNTKKSMQLGSGNIFLLWGYVCTAVTLVVFAGVFITGNSRWSLGWWGIPLIGFPINLWLIKRQPKSVITYINKVITTVWRYVTLFGICITTCILLFSHHMELLIPLSLMLCSIGTMLTGALLTDRWMRHSGMISFCLSIVILTAMISWLSSNVDIRVYWSYFYTYAVPTYALCFVFMMIIPGYRLNYKAKKEAYV